MVDWRETNLTRKPAAFAFAHGVLKLVAILAGFAATALSLMALVGALTESFPAQVGVAIAGAITVPALVAHLLRPKDDPIVAIGFRSETYALVLLGFAVAFVIGVHDRAAPLLAREAERAERAGAPPVAWAARFLARADKRR
jgi:urea transporter